MLILLCEQQSYLVLKFSGVHCAITTFEDIAISVMPGFYGTQSYMDRNIIVVI